MGCVMGRSLLTAGEKAIKCITHRAGTADDNTPIVKTDQLFASAVAQQHLVMIKCGNTQSAALESAGGMGSDDC